MINGGGAAEMHKKTGENQQTALALPGWGGWGLILGRNGVEVAIPMP